MDKTSFGEEVYSVVASIPPGRVLTYGQIAYLIGITFVRWGNT